MNINASSFLSCEIIFASSSSKFSRNENLTVSVLNNEFSKMPELSTTVIFLILSLLTFDKKEINKPKPTIKNGIDKVIIINFLFFT